MDQHVMAFIASSVEDWPYNRATVAELWRHHLAAGLPNRHFVTEFTSGKRERFFQRLWEMLLARHLCAQGHILKSPDNGPDFRFEHDGRVVWVEAISPEPRGLPSDWMQMPPPNTYRVSTVPHDEIALRWTAAFKEKFEKLKAYRSKGIVGNDDAYVIAIHGGQLGLIPLDCGVSRLPLALETVFPVGPLAIPFDRVTQKLGQAEVSLRFDIAKANGSTVPTTSFVDQTHAGVSAVIGFSRDHAIAPELSLHVVHNPFARVRVPFGVLGRSVEEWYGEPVGTEGVEIDLRKYEKPPESPVENG
ncbi:hypothetical protein FM996_03050 [Methylosinus sporium]|uniref:Uncharacterized protein n=1 Tax=Methylosinus sporium TaxID=428 RepID=A0A549T5P6_METSR|nr:hypothetical protein [Methylosinus sporium]TRL37172.1 hypothetical protein FM996_03050 [Methylosinus sporium]